MLCESAAKIGTEVCQRFYLMILLYLLATDKNMERKIWKQGIELIDREQNGN